MPQLLLFVCTSGVYQLQACLCAHVACVEMCSPVSCMDILLSLRELISELDSSI